MDYYQILAISYFSVFGLWWALYSKSLKFLYPAGQHKIQRPWVQTGLVLLAAVLVIAIGWLYSKGFLVPEYRLGSVRLSECLNQMIIFSPIPLMIMLSRQTFHSAWLPWRYAGPRLALGLALGLIAIFIFYALSSARHIDDILLDVFHLQNAHLAVQIFLEDLAIALLLSRLSSALSAKSFVLAILAVAVLFSVGHIPASLESGVPVSQIFVRSTFDAGLTFAAGFTLYKSKDFLWLFPIHYSMDMMQFYSGLTP